MPLKSLAVARLWVYRAEQLDGRPVAVKRWIAGHAPTKCDREARLLARLDHPNIAKFYGFQPLANGEAELIMEWVGPTLSSLCKGGKLWPCVAVHVVQGILQGLDHLHGQGEVHCDLSPRNVLLSPQGQVKLVDFGLAKEENAPRKTDSLKGSPPYISPEQASQTPLDGRSDLFAVGVIFYELLAGMPPYRNKAAVTPQCPGHADQRALP